MGNTNRSAEKEAFWRMALKEHEQSGRSVREFCKREGLSEPSFYSWRKKIKQRDEDQASVVTDKRRSLIPVDIVESEECVASIAAAPHLEVVTPKGLTFRFHQDIEPQLLHTLLNVVARCDGAVPC